MGHPVEIFTSPPPDGCICAICHDVLLGAVVMKGCGHSFCEECAGKTNDTSCPNCRLVISGTIPNFTLRDLIGSLGVKCMNGEGDGFDNPSNKRGRGENGESIVAGGGRCNWTGRCNDLQSHQNICNLQVIACSVEGCDHRCRRENMNKHLSGDGFLHHMNLMHQSITARYEKKMADMNESITARYERKIMDMQQSLRQEVEDNRRKISELQQKVASHEIAKEPHQAVVISHRDVRDAVLDIITRDGGNSYDGVAIQNIVHKLQGFTQSDIMEAVSYLSREGHIYSTIDENHWQFAS